jgi:hypothetical protein
VEREASALQRTSPHLRPKMQAEFIGHNPDEPEPTSKTISGKTILLIVLPVIVLHFLRVCF